MDSQKQLDLGPWVGLQKAFANVSSGCSAARAECLKQVRDSHMLDDLGFTWEEFCTLHAGISRRHADNLIHQYERFGDAYFRLSEIARISPRNFEQIAEKVTAGAIEINGQKLALVPENAAKIRAAIQSLRNRARRLPAPPRSRAGVIELRIRVDALAADFAQAVAALDPAVSTSEGDRAALRGLAVYAANKWRTLLRQLAGDAGDAGD